MHTANLQIQGLVMAVAAINNLLVSRQLVSVDDIHQALRKVEADFRSDERLYEDLSPAHRDAVCFPIRLLQLANLGQSEHAIQTYAELARAVAKTKHPYNDQI
ncbi:MULTISPECIES: hypothetical protein [unclassified Chelatococcus]|uniref:hypothetical protein n=1 Tax=unclassified Chelatococcus TaxID=2638111 RepID=UPI001BD18B8D|nr:MULTISPECIES: hypothetical protein [unclassified Chelatococcus]MBS7696524.1 hypothetical protein [Chelatococcus sp. YT9]MBX3555090.1 hypothetical protein [Chelatococcus sp.]